MKTIIKRLTIVQWMEQHQDEDCAGAGIDALWEIVGGGMKLPNGDRAEISLAWITRNS